MARKDITYDQLVADGEKPDFSRLRWRILYVLREDFADNKSEMARVLGCESSAIGNWIRRDGGMKSEYAFRLQDQHFWNARWLLTGEGEQKIPPPPAPEEAELLEKYRSAPERKRDAVDLILESP